MNAKTKRLVESAILIALATALSFIQIPMPMGGSITLLSMLPIIIIPFKYGTKWGVLSSFVFSLFQLIIGFMSGTFKGIVEPTMFISVMLLDYIFAYTSLGLAAIFKNKFKSVISAFVIGSVFVIFLRFCCSFTSGFLFFGSYAEWFFTEVFTSGAYLLEKYQGKTLFALYSLIYNATYLVPEMISTPIVGAILIRTIPSKISGISLKNNK